MRAGRRLVVGAWAALLLLAGVVLLRGPGLQTDLRQFLPRGSDAQQQLLLDELQQGPASRVVIAAIGGADSQALAASSERLVACLRKEGRFARVLNAPVISARPAEPLFRYRYLLTDSALGLGPGRLRDALQARLADLASSTSALLVDKHVLAADPLGAYRRLARALRGQGASPRLLHGVWFTPSGDRALILVASGEQHFDLAAQQSAVEQIRAAFSASAGPGQRLELTGPAAFAVQSKAMISGEALRLSLLATAGVMLLLVAVFRSLAVVLLSALPLATGVVAGAAAVTLAFGGLHGITLAFGFSLIGVAVDYPIHLFSYARTTGDTRSAARRLWPTLQLGVLTTALGYCALLFSGFAGLSQLGLFAVVGLLAAVAATRWLLPALYPSTPRFAGRAGARVLALFDARARWLPPLLLAAAAVLLASTPHLWEQDLGSMNPIPAQSRALDHRLRAALGAADVRQLLVLEGPSIQAVLERAERLEPALRKLSAQGALAGFDLPSHYLPSVKTQQARQAHLPGSGELTQWLSAARRGLPFRDGAFAPFVQAMAASRALPPLLPAMLRDTAAGARLGALLPTHRGRAFGIVSLTGVSDAGAIQALAAGAPGVRYVDLSAEAAQLIGGYRDEALELFATGALIILLMLFAALRKAGAVLRVVTPTAAAIACAAALLVLTGTPLSLFHLSSLLLVLGIGLDYGLFYERLRADVVEQRATATALVVCNLTTVVVFGALATSQVPVLQAIGATVAIGAPLSLIFTAMMATDAPSRDAAAAAVFP